jgi:hypothetical protein
VHGEVVLVIKDVVIVYRDLSVWASGGIYEAVPIVPLKDGEILFRKSYSKGTPTDVVWNDIRKAMTKHFFDIFYPSVVWQTIASPTPIEKYAKVSTPEGTRWVTRHIFDRQSRLPEFYEWNPRFRKFVMTPEAYISRTEEMGGGMMIGVSDDAYGVIRGMGFLDVLQEMNKGKTVRIFLFVYPDRYDQEIRAMFELIITFWG